MATRCTFCNFGYDPSKNKQEVTYNYLPFCCPEHREDFKDREFRAKAKASCVKRFPTPASHGFEGSLEITSYWRLVSSR